MVRTASRLPERWYAVPDLSVSVKLPVIGDPERQPVSAFPLMDVPLLAPVELAPAFAPGAVWLGLAFWSGVVEFGVCAGGAPGVVPGCCGVVLGVCGDVLGVEVCEPAVAPLCWSELAGELLLGVVWAATQIAESSSKDNSVACRFMAVSRLRYMSLLWHSRRVAGSWESGGISSPHGDVPVQRICQ